MDGIWSRDGQLDCRLCVFSSEETGYRISSPLTKMHVHNTFKQDVKLLKRAIEEMRSTFGKTNAVAIDIIVLVLNSKVIANFAV